MTHTILMGDPAHFSVKGGANPHTRDRWGRRKEVDRSLAIEQWRAMKRLLESVGLRVIVVPPDPDWPGSVYPANAGFRNGDDFVLSHLTPTRAGEAAMYRAVIEPLGLRCHELEHRFEGEADLFPAGEFLLFTHGVVEKQRFVPQLGIPPWKRVYGFRSQREALDEIRAIHPLDRDVLPIDLIDEAYYHGDTCLCSFGPERRYLLAYLDVIAPESRAQLEKTFGDDLIPIGRADAAIYACNSFAFTRDGQPHLVMPAGVSDDLLARIREREIHIHQADVSEFYKKGGGSVKCMIGDLGEIV